MSPDGSGKDKEGSTDEFSGGRLQGFLANVPEDVLAALVGELEKRIRRNSGSDDSNNSYKPSGTHNDNSRGKNHLEMRKKGKERLKHPRRSSNSCNILEVETSKEGAKRKSVVLNKHIVLSASSSSSEDDGFDNEDSYSLDTDLDKDSTDKEQFEVDLSYNVQFRRLSNSEVCFFKGKLLRDEAGREFEEKAADALKLYCREVDKHFKEIKPRHLQKTLKYVREQFGDGLSEVDIIRFLKKRWQHWRDNLRRNVRAGNATRPMQVDEESWKKFKDSCGKTYQRQKDAAAKRKTRQRTGSGGLMSIKTKFFQDWGSMPTDDMLQEILEKGGYAAFKKRMMEKGFAPKKFKAMDYVKETTPGIIFKVKSRKGKEIETEVCYIDSDSDKEKGECSGEKNDGSEGTFYDPENGENGDHFAEG